MSVNDRPVSQLTPEQADTLCTARPVTMVWQRGGRRQLVKAKDLLPENLQCGPYLPARVSRSHYANEFVTVFERTKSGKPLGLIFKDTKSNSWPVLKRVSGQYTKQRCHPAIRHCLSVCQPVCADLARASMPLDVGLAGFCLARSKRTGC